MEGIAIYGPKPRADVVAAIERDRARVEVRARRYTPAVEVRSRKNVCGGCGMGGFDGHHCKACDYTPDEARRIEHRTAPAVNIYERAHYPDRIEHSASFGPILDVR